MAEEFKIGLALGSGAAHGFAHIGVLRALDEMGVKADIICGTSIGAVVAAAHMTGEIDGLLRFAASMSLVSVLGILDVTISRGGLVASDKVFERFRSRRTDIDIAALPLPFGAVATDLATGREIWLREGDLLNALKASSAIPGLFPPIAHHHHWLVDGALVNPVPVSLARALGADFVIAVGLSASRMTLPVIPGQPQGAVTDDEETSLNLPEAPERPAPWHAKVGALIEDTTKTLFSRRAPHPTLIESMVGSIAIMQSRIMRSRLVGEPPEVLIAPMLGRIGVLEFDKAQELIEIGYRTTRDMTPMIEHALSQA